MQCPLCQTDNPPSAVRCGSCNTPFPVSEATLAGTNAGVTEAWTAPVGATTVNRIIERGPIPPGTLLAGRYEILQLLGEGGMGAVYKARDLELERLVAVKLIRPDLASHPEILRRFKQELILARDVTHRNVVRIFDLGQTEGIKFITMEYVEGRDLRVLLKEKGKFAPAEAVPVMTQICRALEAAHEAGVVHRDLKPQNILLDPKDRVYVMDFGIAHSLETPGMTQTGVLLGTPEYMSPEQAKGMKVDARSDLFSVGIIFYELLTGISPYQADTAMATLLKRTQEPARPPIELEPGIPKALNDVVQKCLQIDPQNRYASAQEIARDLEAWQSTGKIAAAAGAAPGYWKWAAMGLSVLLVAALVTFRLKGPSKPPAAHAPVSVLVADFTNATGDSVFDGTIEPTLNVAIEGASFISSFNRAQARKIAEQVQPGVSSLDASVARMVAVREGIGALVSGTIAKQGAEYLITATTLDPSTGKVLVDARVKASDKQGVLNAVNKLAAQIRKALGDTIPESVQIAAAETFTADSLEAAHEYAEAQNLQWQGKWEEAIRHYLQAVQLDPNFGRAYSGIAAVDSNMGQVREAVKYYTLAMAHLDRMSEREKYRTRGGYYLLMRDARKATEEFSALVKQFPADSAGVANLAYAYVLSHDMPHAVEQARRAVEISPQNVPQRNNLGLLETYNGNFAAGLREQQAVLQTNPRFVLAHVGMAMSQLGNGQVTEAKATYEKMAKLDAQGASMAASGLADLALYEGRAADAIKILEQGIEADRKEKNQEAAGKKLAMLAEAHLLAGQAPAAGAAAEKAVTTSPQDMAVMFWAARVDLALGQEARALALAKQLGAQLQADPQAYAKLIEGEALLKRQKSREALDLFQQAGKLADTWVGHYDLGLAYLAAGAFTEAYSEFELCKKRKGEAAAAFLDEEPTYRIYPPLLYYFGRAQEGLKSPAASESYRTFVAIRGNGAADSLLTDARRRLAGQ